MIEKYQAGEPFNVPEADEEHLICLAHPCGGETIRLRAHEVEPYNCDPDGFAAEHFGLTKQEYRDWVIQEGHALCGAHTKAGKLCRNFVTQHGSEPGEWKAANRKEFCGSHRH
ncbi:hypothetical protein [Bradyrhizobium sp. CCBAU 21360]|uniref:hypothetical protein n=1 Tax=Bradyrhizobium sp. CCBAU 21360 TaxID=1325081 RepID=UPI002305A030|nr:hypothetical protein [Bradyrhizobium sp. CCBAU 21360]MDA9448286.1 hypothetical protein [Bradyrhizobium sp. CCBAU 21360]